MNEEEIKSIMDKKGLTVGGLAERFEKSHTTIHFLIKRQLKSKDLDRRLARALGVTLKQLRGEQAVGQ